MGSRLIGSASSLLRYHEFLFAASKAFFASFCFLSASASSLLFASCFSAGDFRICSRARSRFAASPTSGSSST